MNESAFFSDRLQEISRELGVSVAVGFLEETQSHLESLSKTDALHVDVFQSDSPSHAVRKVIDDWRQNPGAIMPVFLAKHAMMARPINTPAPSVAVCCLDESLLHDTVHALLAAASDRYKLVLVVTFSLPNESVQNFLRSLGFRIKSKTIDASAIEGKSFSAIVEEALGAQQLPVYKTLGRLNQVKPVLSILNHVFQTESKILQTRRLLNAQDQQISRKDEQNMNTMELSNNIRQAILKYSNDIDKGFRLKYDELNKPVTGAFTKKVAELASDLKDFKRETIAEKDERVEIRLDDNYQSHFLEGMKKTTGHEMRQDAEFLTASTKELISRVNNTLASKNIEPITIRTDVIDFPDYRKSITSYGQFNRVYKGELIKKGLMEYFVALRDYTGVIMVATGLLAPISIIASISESGFLKHVNNGVKFSMAGIALFLIVYGVYDLRTRIPRRRKEEFHKEIEKAREFVSSEGKRMASEISRDWMTATSNWVKEIGQAITNAFEKKMKDTTQSRSNNLNQDKVQQQRRQQNLDAQQRSLTNAERAKEAMSSRWRDLYTETEKKLTIS